MTCSPGNFSRESAGEVDRADSDDEDVLVGAAAGQVLLPAQPVAHVRHAVQGAGDHRRAVREDPGEEVRDSSS